METKVIRRTFAREYEDSFFLFNAFTNCLREVDREGYHSIDDYVNSHESDLLKEGVICPDDQSYYDIADLFYSRDTRSSHSITITDASTFRCNLRCIYCMQQNISGVGRELTPIERVDTWKKVMSLLGARELSLCLFGGEPFFNKAYIDDLLNVALTGGLGVKSIGAVTNGTLIDSHSIEIINRHGISHLQITIDGPSEIQDVRRVTSEGEGTYRSIIGNISKILKYTDADLYINTVMDKSNKDKYIGFVAEFSDLFRDQVFTNAPRIVFNLGNECDPYRGCDFTSSSKLTSGKDIFDYYIILGELIDLGVSVCNFMPSMSCIRDNFREVVVGPSGDLYNCISGIGADEFRMCSRDDLYHSPASALAQIAEAKSSLKNCTCRKCLYYGMCNGGCYYDMIVNKKSSSCQRSYFDSSIDSLMDILRRVEEVMPDVYRLRSQGV